jgi:hypothetical protein
LRLLSQNGCGLKRRTKGPHSEAPKKRPPDLQLKMQAGSKPGRNLI